jgi:hypothetical protein
MFSNSSPSGTTSFSSVMKQTLKEFDREWHSKSKKEMIIQDFNMA